MSTAIAWPHIIESQLNNKKPIEPLTKHYVRRAGTNDTGLTIWNNCLSPAPCGTFASTKPYVACAPRYAFNVNGWFVNALPDNDEMALAASGTCAVIQPYKARSWYTPNFSSWLVDIVPEAIDAGQQSSATTVPNNVFLGTGAEWFGHFHAAGGVRVKSAQESKEPVRVDEFVANGTAIRAVAEHFLKGTRDLTQKERSFLSRFYSRAHKKGK